MGFQGMTIVVTGAASGMGKAATELLVERGAAVYAIDIDERGLEEACGASGAIARVCDVSCPAEVDSLVERVVAERGTLDGLCNFAGVIRRSGLLDCTDDDFDYVMKVNAKGTFNLCRAAGRVMKERGRGSIVNVSSVWSEIGSAGVLAYCASKGAVSQITRAAALDLAGSGVRVNEVRPGETDTPMLRSGRGADLSDAEIGRKIERIAATIPERRLAEPEEIARAAMFLLSDESSYMQGASITVDGAYSAC